MNTNLTELLNNVSIAVKNLSDTIITLQMKQTEKTDIKALKAEVASLKALMLNRYTLLKSICRKLVACFIFITN